MPVVSVIVPVYNAEDKISRCVSSILTQDYKDFELLLVDDGSSDGTAAILDAYAQSDSRIRVLHKENSGVSDTRNRALEMAVGKYIQFADADDWLVPEATGMMVRAAEESGAGMVISDFYRVVGNRISHKGSIDEEGLITRLQFAEYMERSPADYYYGVLWNKLFRRETIETHRIRMDENLRWCEDFIFNMEYILHIESVYVLRMPLYYYVKTEGSLISKSMNVPDLVRTKLSVIEYYTGFYKSIYNSADYAAKRPAIYGYLLDFAHDDGAMPGLARTKKLGTERTLAAQDVLIRDMWSQHYYETRLFERHLRGVALQTDLEVRELRILLYLQHFGVIEDIRELAESVGATQIGLVATLERMALRKLVIMDVAHPGSARLGEQADRVLKLLEDATVGVSAVCCEGMTEEEAAEFRRLLAHAEENMRTRLGL
ncbi:MAG: glycosyltransferase [Clostridiales bacterium]|nr:glycosyltransferase [Clostridiales bacterium]